MCTCVVVVHCLSQRSRSSSNHPSTPPPQTKTAEIWDALRAAISLDPATARAVLDAAEVKVVRADLSASYDARGFRYELPNYVLSDPTNLVSAA